jgi:D-serine deaminase-like pyridoxal phosphate-dependent protein
MSAPTVEELLAERVDGRFRGFGGPAAGLAVGELGAQRFDLRRGDLPLPLLVLRESALAHNIAVMHGWCAERGLALAPHGKTAMAPQLVQRQLAAGAWGMTAATMQQLAVMRAAGARRVIVANEVAGRAEIAWLARERAAGCDVYCLVDSVEGVAQLDAGLAAAAEAARSADPDTRPADPATRSADPATRSADPATRSADPLARSTDPAARSADPAARSADPATAPLGVLVELGGARAGCRSAEQAFAVAAAVAAAPRLVLAGVEGYEGTLGNDREPATLAAVDAFLDRLRELTIELDARGAFAAVPEILVSAGGSALFDRVAERLAFPAPLSRPARVVVRAGCYLTHDDGLYARVSPLPSLRPALELWARVLSCPEPGLAIAGFGKRDAPYDLGLPVVRDADGVTVESLADQHAFLRDPAGTLRPGDVIRCGISHPCTAFDKWSLIPVVDDEDVVIDAVRTLF